MPDTPAADEYRDDNRPKRRVTDRWLFKIGQGDDVEELIFDPRKILLSETLAMEAQYNLTWPQIISGVAMGRTSAIAAVVWVLRKRKNPKLRPAEIEFSMEDFDASEDPDYLPAYGGIPQGEAFGDEWPDDTGTDTTDDTADTADTAADEPGPKDSLTPEHSSSEPED